MVIIPAFVELAYSDELFNIGDQMTQIGTPKFMLKSKKQTDGMVIDNKDKKSTLFDKKQNSSDSAKREDKIIGIFEVNEQHIVKIELVDYNQEITIAVYNMLGKQVLEIFRGYPHQDSDYPYSFHSNLLPNGVYFCVLQGRHFRKARKFVVARS